MGRTIPASSYYSSTIPTTPPLSLPLTIMAIASSITIIFTLCMSHHRKSSTLKSQPSSPPSLSSKQPTKKPNFLPTKNTTKTSFPPSLPSKQPTKTPNVLSTKNSIKTSSPPPPPPPPPSSIQIHKQKQDITNMCPVLSPRRRLSVTLSMRFHEGYMSKIRNSRRERQLKRKALFQPEPTEDLVWRKTIILGERCRVPSDDDDEEFAMYDEKGNRRRNYHPKAPRSLPVSRSNSFAVDDILKLKLHHDDGDFEVM